MMINEIFLDISRCFLEPGCGAALNGDRTYNARDDCCDEFKDLGNIGPVDSNHVLLV